jgi:hypothetical protein
MPTELFEHAAEQLERHTDLERLVEQAAFYEGESVKPSSSDEAGGD